MNDSAIAADEKYIQTLYHGTTSKNVASIKKHGLRPSHDGYNYVSIHPDLAAREAHNTVSGDEPGLGEKKPRGGKPVIIHVNRRHPAVRGFQEDPAYKNTDEAKTSFRTKNHIPPEAITHVEKVTGRRETIGEHGEWW